MDDLNAIAVFTRVVEAESFSGAAKQLGLSKSAVSKQVRRLEDRLGARLLNRTTRSLGLTAMGAAYYERCARVMAEVAAADRTVSALHPEPRGTLKVNAPVTFGIMHLAPLLPDFLAACPDARLDLSLNDRFIDLIAEGYDLVIRIGWLADSSLIARKLAPSRHVVCAAPAYLDARGTPATPADLARHACLTYSNLDRPDIWRFTGPKDGSDGGDGGDNGGTHTVRISGNLTVNNGDILAAAARAGTGIVRLPTFMVGGDLKSGRLRQVLPDYAVADTAIYAVYPENRHLSPLVRAFVDFLVDRLGSAPYWD